MNFADLLVNFAVLLVNATNLIVTISINLTSDDCMHSTRPPSLLIHAAKVRTIEINGTKGRWIDVERKDHCLL
ncbi:hypothetical protein [Peribacillus sp. TH24]|uniref:hypothetical protein n=1 Tax=Peribacillus sp. TH24 TaxID=2798483 RepID=UPI00191215A2|nr:hypothetical protein [Peribacillus sp. TH24]MBK5444814.1 hypothetical protein [Peribacillus sp. TH24]